MTPTSSTPIVIYADQEHGAIRFAVLFILLATFVLAFFLLSLLLRSSSLGLASEYWFPLSCFAALILSLATAAAGEAAMKRTWLSGNSVIINERGIQAKLSRDESKVVDWSKSVVATKWYFELKGYRRGGREKRVPGSYNCLACQLQQDDDRFIVHSYLAQKQAIPLIEKADFHEIRPAELQEGSVLPRLYTAPERPTLPRSVLTGNDGRYWLAERRRWTEGLELTPDDFELLMNHVTRNLNN